MKRLVFAVALALNASAFAQDSFFVPPTPGAQINANSGVGMAAVDKYGTVQVGIAYPSGTPQPVSGTVNVVATPGATSFLKNEDAAAADADAGVAAWTKRKDSAVSDANANGDYQALATNTFGAVRGDISQAFQANDNVGLLKAEDSAHVTADAGVSALAVRNDGKLTSFTSTNGDYIPIATNNAGAIWIAESVLEDNPAGSGDLGFVQMQKLQSAISADAADGDYGTLKGDLGGRLITTQAPAGETWQACTSPVTNTTRTQIKAAVASNRIYVTHVTCSNTSAVASLVYIEDGVTPIYVGQVPVQSAGGNWSITLPIPLRLTSATALQMEMVTTATSTTCCASGYISTN